MKLEDYIEERMKSHLSRWFDFIVQVGVLHYTQTQVYDDAYGHWGIRLKKGVYR